MTGKPDGPAFSRENPSVSPRRGVLAAAIGTAALAGLLFGFDTAVIAGVTGDLTALFALTPETLGITVSAALWGTLVGAFSLGILNKFLEPYAGAVLGKILVLVLIILFIQKRPRGLFALKGRAVEA